MSQFRRQKKYVQRYRMKWEFMDEFKGWLKPLPQDTTKAYCSVCNVVIKAHLCDLRKHGAAKKHINATLLVRTLQNLNKDEDGDLITEFKAKNQFGIPGTDDEEDASDIDDDNNHRWPPEAIESLLKHIKTYWKDLKDGLRKKKDIWEDISMAMIADGLSVNSLECNKKFRNMKLRYLFVLAKSLVGEASKFRIEYFEDLHQLLAKDPETIAFLEQKKLNLKSETVDGDASDEDTIIMEESGFDSIADGEFEWTETSIHLMLDFLQEFKDFFSGKEGENEEEVWQNVTEQMHLKGIEVDENQCRRKWQSLVNEFNHYKSIMESEGSLPLWPYFTRVRHIIKNVKIPTQSTTTERRPIKVRLKRGRPRGRKRKLPDPPEDSEGSEAEFSSPCKRNASPRRREDDRETLRAMRRLTETAAIWNRMDTIEMRLDDISDHSETQRQMNSLLRQILKELSILSDHISPHSDPLNDRDGITIVVPNSDNSI